MIKAKGMMEGGQQDWKEGEKERKGKENEGKEIYRSEWEKEKEKNE